MTDEGFQLRVVRFPEETTQIWRSARTRAACAGFSFSKQNPRVCPSSPTTAIAPSLLHSNLALLNHRRLHMTHSARPAERPSLWESALPSMVGSQPAPLQAPSPDAMPRLGILDLSLLCLYTGHLHPLPRPQPAHMSSRGCTPLFCIPAATSWVLARQLLSGCHEFLFRLPEPIPAPLICLLHCQHDLLKRQPEWSLPFHMLPSGRGHVCPLVCSGPTSH